MAREGSLRWLRRFYAALLRLYPKPYQERFGEPMQQTFQDLLRERAEKNQGLFRVACWMFVETFAATIRENATMMIVQKRPFVVITLVTGILLLVPLVATQTVEGFNWDPFDFVFMGILIFGSGLVYHLVSSRLNATAYKTAVGLAVAAGFVLVWMNAAVGIIGDASPKLANFLYVAGVLAVGFVGALLARFQPRGMARALFAMALAQALGAVIALTAGWGGEPVAPGRFSVLTGTFVLIWVSSALLFLRAARVQATPQ